MHMAALLAGLELLLIIMTVRKLREMRRLETEVHKSLWDLAIALAWARQGRYGEAHAQARSFIDRMRAFKRGEPYRPPPPPPPIFTNGFAP